MHGDKDKAVLDITVHHRSSPVQKLFGEPSGSMGWGLLQTNARDGMGREFIGFLGRCVGIQVL
jgi:hypothetical protein